MCPPQRTNSTKMKQESASQMKSKTHGNKTLLTFLTIFSTSEHIASFIVSLPYHLGYFSQLEKLPSLFA